MLASKFNHSKSDSKKILLEKNFLSQLKGLQAMIKESMLEAPEAEQSTDKDKISINANENKKEQSHVLP